jgi:sugar lactone lactonase YvrE
MHLRTYLSAVAAVVAATWVAAAASPAGAAPSAPHLLYGGLAAGSGSTIGPDRALYANDPVNGTIVRIDPSTGAASTYADCLPTRLVPSFGFSGGMDVAFVGHTAYALVTVVSDPLLGGSAPDGVYRIDGAHSCTLVADIGAWSAAHQPSGRGFDYVLVTGVQFAMQPWRGGFLVTDGHHNRVLRVDLDGSIAELKGFGDVVPTGLAVQGDTIYMAEAGPIVNGGEEIGKIVGIDAHSGAVSDVAASAPLLVDVERGRGETLFGLAQGTHSNGDAGSPADPNTGELLHADGDGGFSVLATGLDRPTSLEVTGTTAYVVTLTGQIWEIDDVAGSPYGGPAEFGSRGGGHLRGRCPARGARSAGDANV